MPSNIRPAIEKWDRMELEDKFHSMSEQNLSLKKQNNQLQKELKILNGRTGGRGIKAFRNISGQEGNESEKLKLERENRVLEQKVKVLKHQLLSYGRPSVSQHSISHRNRPGSVASHTNRSATQQPEETFSLSKQDSSVNQKVQFKNSPLEERRIYNGHNSEVQDNMTIAKNVADKTTLIRLHRQNRAMELEVKEMKFSMTKSDQKLASLRSEYDKVVGELESARLNIHTLEESMRNMRQDALRSNESSHKSVGIAEKELRILEEENRVLRTAHDRLIANSLELETSTKLTTDELNRLNGYVSELQHSLAEQSQARKLLQEELFMLQSRNTWLEARNTKLKDKKQAAQTPNEPTFPSQHTNSPEKYENEEYSPSPPAVRMGQNKPTQKYTKDTNNSILDRLFQDVISIVDSHLSRNGEIVEETMEAHGPMDSKISSKWQKMYEQIYLELEKVRNMLVSQYTINQGMKQEMNELRASVDFAKQDYENKLADYVKQLNNKSKETEILENQLKSIASNGEDVLSTLASGTILSPYQEFGATEMTLRLTKLVVSEEGLKLTGSAKPVLFLSMEFFDFELQTTPLLTGPEAIFDYSTVYEVIVSSLFVHYLETDGITIELFQVQGTAYQQLTSAKVSLKKLISGRSPTQLTGRLEFPSANLDDSKQKLPTLASLNYFIDVPFSLIKSLSAQKRRMTASSYLPTQLEDKSLHNELIVQIHRCNGLEKLTTDQTLPDSYVAYQLFDLPVHMSKAVKLSSDPEFNDTRAWTLPVMSQALHEYLKSQELLIYIMLEERPTSQPSEQNKAAALGFLNLPLFPLARNQRIRGTFPLVKLDCSISEASIDVSIHWKFSYVFETDDELQDELISKTKVREPTQSQNFPGKTKEVEFSIAEPLVPFPEQSQESENNALSSKPKESSENQLKPISASARLQEILRPQTPNEEEDSEKEDLEDQELERRLLHLPTPHSPVQKEEPERVLIPPKLCHAPAPSPPLPEATIAALHIDNGSVASSPASSSVASDATYTTSSTQQPVKPSKKDNPSTEKPKVEEQEIEETVEEPQNSDRQMEKMLELGEKVQLSPDRGLKSGGTEEKPLAAVRRSLLGDLPSLQPVAAKRATKAVEFTTPLHSSIPLRYGVQYSKKAFCVVEFGQLGSYVAVQRSFKRQYLLPVRAKVPHKDSIKQWFDKFLAFGDVNRKKRNNTRWARTDLVIATVLSFFTADIKDGAPPHWALRVRAYLSKVFPQRWMGRGSPNLPLPPYSPDLTPCDFFL